MENFQVWHKNVGVFTTEKVDHVDMDNSKGILHDA